MRIALRLAPLVALLALVAELSLRPMAESDLFFRIKAGQEILARRGLPGQNLFSFTYPDHPDVDAAWLFEVGAAALHARGVIEPAATLAAETGMSIFRVAFERWIAEKKPQSLAAHVLSTLATLRAVAAESERTSAGEPEQTGPSAKRKPTRRRNPDS